MNIDLVLLGHHLQRIQKYAFVHGDCLFDFLTFLFHYSQTSLQLQTQCMTHFAQSLQQPINPQIQELINMHFNVSLLYEDHGVIFLQNYIKKLSINANSKGLWGDNRAIFCLENYLHRPISANFGSLWGDNRAIFCLANYLHRPIHAWSKNIV
jgi:hypothetical protein